MERALARAAHQLAPLPEGVGRLVEALELEQQVAALLEVARDRGGRGAGVDRLLRVAERLGAALLVAAPEQRLGEVEQDEGALAAELARRISDDYLVVSCLAALSFLYRWKRFERHSLRRSARCARRAIALARDLDNGRLEARGLAALALCYRDMGRLTWARAIAEKAVREAQAAGIRRRRAAEIWYVHGLILKELGRTEEARASLFEARGRLERRLLGVASAATRARMVERDPLLREIEQARS